MGSSSFGMFGPQRIIEAGEREQRAGSDGGL
jgi:hypothetical protein